MQAFCIFCEKRRREGRLNFPQMLSTALFLKYNQEEEVSIDDFLKHSRKKFVLEFYEKLNNGEEEHLTRYYESQEINQNLAKGLEYFKYRMDTPHLFMSPGGELLQKWNRQRKYHLQVNQRDTHYRNIKYQLGILKAQPRLQTQPQDEMIVLAELEEPSYSLISLLSKFESTTNQGNKKKPNPTQVSPMASKMFKVRQSTQPVKLHTQQSNQGPNLLVSKKLKTILHQELLIDTYKPQRASKTSMFSKLKSNVSNQKNMSQLSKSPPVVKNRVLTKMSSQPDVIAGIYLTKSSYKKNLQAKTRKLLTLVSR